MGFPSHQGGWGSLILKVFESLLCLLSPLELVQFLKEFEETEAPHAES
jgi:hypothetical protein